MKLIHTRTGAIDEATKDKLRQLTVPDYWAMARWVCYDGSTFALVALEDSEPIGWACLTFEELPEARPVVGVFVADGWRGKGIATQLVRALLAMHRERVCAAGELMAASKLWPRYRTIAAELGMTFEEYE